MSDYPLRIKNTRIEAEFDFLGLNIRHGTTLGLWLPKIQEKFEAQQSTIKELEEKHRNLINYLNNKTFGASLDCTVDQAFRIGMTQVIEAADRYLTQLDE